MSHLRDSPPTAGGRRGFPPTPGTRLPLINETRLTPGSPSVHARRFPAPGRSLIHQNGHADITVHPPVLPKKNVSSPATQPLLESESSLRGPQAAVAHASRIAAAGSIEVIAAADSPAYMGMASM